MLIALMILYLVGCVVSPLVWMFVENRLNKKTESKDGDILIISLYGIASWSGLFMYFAFIIHDILTTKTDIPSLAFNIPEWLQKDGRHY